MPNEKEPPCVVELQLAVRRLQEQVESLQAERFKERMRRASGEMLVLVTTPILINESVKCSEAPPLKGLAFALREDTKLSNVNDAQHCPGYMDVFHSHPLRREMECLNRRLDG